MKIVLFDMDGTLTAPRKKINMSTCRMIGQLQDAGIQVGIVTGSDMEYIREQCSLFWDMSPVDPSKICFFPCNGTKFYHYETANSDIKIIHQCNMKNELGVESFNSIVYALFGIQQGLQYAQWGKNMPLAGKFVDYRGSMINYCPIGRSANSTERAQWVEVDTKYDIRRNMLQGIMSSPVFDNVTVKLGGDTSFDIYPHGWDKTYVMRHLKYMSDNPDVYFIGDRCEEGGNDKELYDVILDQNDDRAFQTSGPLETINIIKEFILDTNS